VYFYFYFYFYFYCVIENNKTIVFFLGKWFSFREIEIEFGFYFDDLTVYFLLFIFFVSFFVFLFSFWYMGEDPFFITFLFFLSLFVCSMLLLVSANNLVLLFVGWEGVGICSFLLINFWHYRKTALKSALFALFLNKIGDFFFFFFFFFFFLLYFFCF
jgi:NADH:ubiquinone oxidoreductase subunit 5 (subunit L)/multisubunit Na+/H+ antiporter MnhA subunit